MEPVRNIKILNPVSVDKINENTYLYKLNQNIAGTLRLTAKAKKDTEITIKYSEYLSNGIITGREYAGNNGIDKYIFRGDKEGETVEFDLAYHGYVYIQIEGLEEPVDLKNIEALVLTSNMEQTASLVTSNPKINKYL